MTADKPWLNIEQQIDLLKSRGLAIDDSKKAEEFLSSNNYFRISGFTLNLR